MSSLMPSLVEELVELLVVDAVRAFDLAVQMRRPGPNVHVPDVEGLDVPVELRLELGAVVPSECEVKAGQVLL